MPDLTEILEIQEKALHIGALLSLYYTGSLPWPLPDTELGLS